MLHCPACRAVLWRRPQSDAAKLTALQRMEMSAAALKAEVRGPPPPRLLQLRRSMPCSSQGRLFEAVECLEKGLVLRHMVHGGDSAEVWAACSTLAELCNQVAMQCLHRGVCGAPRRALAPAHRAAPPPPPAEDFAMVLELLRKAEVLTERDEEGRAVTLNNLGVFFRRQNKLHTALKYMREAVALEERLPSVAQPGDTHINYAVTLSQCGRHKAALKAAKRAVALLQTELFAGVHPGQRESAAHRADRIATMAIAHHNVGVEHEFLGAMTPALAAYAAGVELASTYLGEAHGVTLMLRNAQLAARGEVEKRKKARESEERRAQREAEAEMLRVAKGRRAAPPAPAVTAVAAGAGAAAAAGSLEALVDSATLTAADTAFGRGERPRPAAAVMLEARLAEIAERGVVRSGAAKNSSAALLSHCDGGVPSAGPGPRPGPARATGGHLFSVPSTATGAASGRGGL